MTLIQGDCVEVMRSMPEDSVDSIVCDPPAGISFMSAKWDSNKGGRRQWVAWFTEVMEEALRVVKPGAHAFVWALPRTSHWTAWALEDAGWEIREVVHHLFGSGFPKSKNLGNGFGTALKPAAENWILARKSLSESSVPRNVLEHGTGALNIAATRISTSENLNGGAYAQNPTAQGARRWEGGALDATGKEYAQPSGRWPANVILSHVGGPDGCQRVGVKRVRTASGGEIHSKPETMGYGKWQQGGHGATYKDPDGFEEVEAWECVDSCPIRLLDEQSGERKSGGASTRSGKRQAGYGFNETERTTYDDVSGASRFFKTFEGEPGFFYCAKSSRAERNKGLEGLPKEFMATMNSGIGKREHNKDEPRAYTQNNHPTVKPLALMRYLVKLVTPPGGVVLDPFAGSGTTLVAAIQEGFEAVGIEREAEYCAIAERRVAHARAEIESQPLALEV